MIKEFIGTGKTIEEATHAARSGLNAPLTADVKIEVIVMPKKKVLGLFGGCDAQVKASYDDGTKEKKQKPRKSRPVQQEKKSAPKKAERGEKNEKPAAKDRPAAENNEKKAAEEITEKDIDLDYVCSYIKTMIDGFKVKDAKLTAKLVDGVIEVDVDCDDYGIIIGRRGETLDAMQYLAGLAVKKAADKYVRVAINVGDYKQKREQTLRALAIKNANYVVRTGRRYGFEPMNPYERRIIHTAVQEVEGAVSRSVGNGMDRRVLIEPEGGVRRSGSGRGRGGSRGAGRSNHTPDPNRERRVDRADIPKFGKIEVNKD